MCSSLLSRFLLCALVWTRSRLDAQSSLTHDGGNVIPNRYLVVYRDGRIPADAGARAQAVGAHMVQRHPRFGIAAGETLQRTVFSRLSGPSTQGAAEEDQAAMRQLAAQPDVEYVLHDRVVTAHHLQVRPVTRPVFSVTVGTATFDNYYNSPQGWAVRQVGGYGADIPGGPNHGPWDITKGKGVRIAILDSGVDASHPDIAPNLALNLSEVNPVELPSVCDDGSPQDQDGHGTWTASLAAGALGPSTGRTVGVAPAATLISIKVLERMPAASGASDVARCNAGEASGLLSWVIQGMDDAIANHADVVSMSLGTMIDLSTGDGAGTKTVFDRITYAAAQAGTVLVAAAGNDATNLANSRYIEIPAQSRGVLAVVASTNPACSENVNVGSVCVAGPSSLAYYSNYGSALDAVAAPGGSYPSGAIWMSADGSAGPAAPGFPALRPDCPRIRHTVSAASTLAIWPMFRLSEPVPLPLW